MKRKARILTLLLALALLVSTTALAVYNDSTNYAAIMIDAAARGDTAAYNAAAASREEKIAARQEANSNYTDPGIAGSGGTISVASVCYVVSGGSVGDAENTSTSSSGAGAATQDQVRAAAAAATAALVDGTITPAQMQTVASTIAAVNSGSATQEQVDNASKILCVAQGNSTSDSNVKTANMTISAGTMASYETLDESGNRVYWEGGRAYRQDDSGNWVAADLDSLPGAVTISQSDLNTLLNNRVAYLDADTPAEKTALHNANEALRATYDYQGGTNGSFFDGTPTKVTVSSGGGEVTINSYIIAASCTTGGTITPSGSYYYAQGSSQDFTISVQNGYALKTVLVDEKPIGAVTSYTFSSISGNHTIHAQVISKASLNGLTLTGDKTAVKSGYGVTVTCVPDATNCIIDTVTATNNATGKTYTMVPMGGQYFLPVNPASPTGARVDYLPVSLADGDYQWTVTVTAHNVDDPSNTFTKTQTRSYTVKGVMYEDDFTGDS